MVTRPDRHSDRRKGEVSRELLAIAGLVALIVLAVGLTWMGWQSKPDDPAAERAGRHIRFQCEACGHSFDMAPTEFHKQWKDVDLSKFPPAQREQVRYKAHCPSCGGRFCCRMTETGEGNVRPAPPTRPSGR